MATDDKDWLDFINATKEKPEAVENDEELEDESLEDDQEDDDKTDPKPKTGEEDDDDAGKKPGKADKDDDEEDDSDDQKSDYQPRLKQFFNEDGTLDAKKIEDAYVESGKHAVDLKQKLEEREENYNQLLDAIKAKPEVAKQLFGEEGAKKLQQGDQKDSEPKDPVLQHVSAQMAKTSRKEYSDFVKDNPDAVSDSAKADKIGRFLKMHGAVYRQENGGEIPGMKESLEAAYRYYGWPLASDKKNEEEEKTKKKDDLAVAVKKRAASRSTPRSKKPAPKKKVDKMEDFFASKLGVKI